jgi:hypothetical protein
MSIHDGGKDVHALEADHEIRVCEVLPVQSTGAVPREIETKPLGLLECLRESGERSEL